jgi:hypothetical protein
MWSVLFANTVPWTAAVVTLLLALAATLLIIRQVRASDGDMSVRLRWLGLHVQRSVPPRTPQIPPAGPAHPPTADDPHLVHRPAAWTAWETDQ